MAHDYSSGQVWIVKCPWSNIKSSVKPIGSNFLKVCAIILRLLLNKDCSKIPCTYS